MSDDIVKYLRAFSSTPMNRAADEITELRAEVERLSLLLWGAKCIYCGAVIGQDKRNQDIGVEMLREHIEVCSEHPLPKLRAQVKLLEGVVETARAFGVLAARAGEWTSPWEEAWIALAADLAALDAGKETT